MKKRVLFVDDDPSILESLRHLFWRERGRWEMVFSLGGRAALTELTAGKFDVVVSDMRMPGLSGAALLREVTEMYPGTVRVLLSGGADPDQMTEALAVSDHMLEKPCNRDRLRAAIDDQSRSTQTSSPMTVTG
jgi:DNA-binding NtrC family response regulator